MSSFLPHSLADQALLGSGNPEDLEFVLARYGDAIREMQLSLSGGSKDMGYDLTTGIEGSLWDGVLDTINDHLGLEFADDGTLTPTSGGFFDNNAAGGGGDLLAANNLSDLVSATTARTNLGVGTGNAPLFSGLALQLQDGVSDYWIFDTDMDGSGFDVLDVGFFNGTTTSTGLSFYSGSAEIHFSWDLDFSLASIVSNVFLDDAVKIVWENVGGGSDDWEIDVDGSGNLTIGYTAAIPLFVFDQNGDFLLPGDLELDGELDHDGSAIGFFGTAPATIQTVSAPNVLTVGGTADLTYSSNERDLINALVADITALHGTVEELQSALDTYGLV